MKILLAIDDSKFSEAAAQALIAHHRLQDLEVRVFHTAEPPTLLVGTELAEYVPPRESVEVAKALVAKTADALRSAGVSVTTDVEQGDAKSTVIDNVEAWGADLIVLGSHGRKGWSDSWADVYQSGSCATPTVRWKSCAFRLNKGPNTVEKFT